VLTPETAAVTEALDFARRLRETGSPLCCYIANRTSTDPGPRSADAIARDIASLPDLQGETPGTLWEAAEKLARLADYLGQIASAQQRELERLARESPSTAITTVPLLPHDVSSIDSLRAIADRLETA
jgi:anion-transporting  ArsA/GET3 family ATPase